jgi:hypothetical protein
MQSLTKILPRLRYIVLADLVETKSVSGVYGSDGINDSYRTQYFTIRKDTDNLPIAGKSMRGSRGLPFFTYKCFSENFSEKEGKNYCSSVTKERYKLIKPDRISAQRICKIVSFKKFETIEICGTGESIYNKTANKLITSLGIVIGNGPLKIYNFIKSGSSQNFLFAHIA